jgi:hypothetical protein
MTPSDHKQTGAALAQYLYRRIEAAYVGRFTAADEKIDARIWPVKCNGLQWLP